MKALKTFKRFKYISISFLFSQIVTFFFTCHSFKLYTWSIQLSKTHTKFDLFGARLFAQFYLIPVTKDQPGIPTFRYFYHGRYIDIRAGRDAYKSTG